MVPIIVPIVLPTILLAMPAAAENESGHHRLK